MYVYVSHIYVRASSSFARMSGLVLLTLTLVITLTLLTMPLLTTYLQLVGAHIGRATPRDAHAATGTLAHHVVLVPPLATRPHVNAVGAAAAQRVAGHLVRVGVGVGVGAGLL